MYKVLDNGKPALLIESEWKKFEYDTFEEALSYVESWLGEEYSIPFGWRGSRYDYSGYGDTIEIVWVCSKCGCGILCQCE